MFILICLRHVRAEHGYCLRHIRAKPERIAQCDDAGLGMNLPGMNLLEGLSFAKGACAKQIDTPQTATIDHLSVSLSRLLD